jgi:Trypsin-like peptidase domain/TIR domain
MAQSLYELLHNCIVKVVDPQGSQGTGFFVAPGLILTCAHVVEAAQKQKMPVEISWNGQKIAAQIQEFRDVSYPDLALLQANVSNHPCVLLQGGAEPYSKLYSYGYPDIEPQGASTTFDSEGWVGNQQEILRLKEGQVRPGMSGSPVLNEQTGSICGIVQWTRDRNTALGGKAMLTKVIFREFAALETQQRQFHQQDRRWANCLTAQQRRKLGLDSATDAIEVFFSYHPKDKNQRDDLETQLAIMKRQKLITSWYDQDITAGKANTQEVTDHLNAADIILLLISADFLASESLYQNEVERAMERCTKEGTRVIPVLLRSVEGWEEMEFGKLQPLPRDRRPVNQWKDKDDAFAHIAKEIRRVVQELRSTS